MDVRREIHIIYMMLFVLIGVNAVQTMIQGIMLGLRLADGWMAH